MKAIGMRQGALDGVFESDGIWFIIALIDNQQYAIELTPWQRRYLVDRLDPRQEKK